MKNTEKRRFGFAKKKSLDAHSDETQKSAFARNEKIHFKKRSRDSVKGTKPLIEQEGAITMLHAGILMSVLLPGMVILGQAGLLVTELMEERMHARKRMMVKGKSHA